MSSSLSSVSTVANPINTVDAMYHCMAFGLIMIFKCSWTSIDQLWPLLSDQSSKSWWNNIVEKNGKLYFPLSSTLSIKRPPSTWYTDIHLVWLHFKNTMKEKITQSEIEVDNGLWSSNASPIVCLFQNKVMFLLKIILINDKPLLNDLSPLSGHLQALVLRRWLLNANSTVLMLTFLPHIQKMSPY